MSDVESAVGKRRRGNGGSALRRSEILLRVFGEDADDDDNDDDNDDDDWSRKPFLPRAKQSRYRVCVCVCVCDRPSTQQHWRLRCECRRAGVPTWPLACVSCGSPGENSRERAPCVMGPETGPPFNGRRSRASSDEFGVENYASSKWCPGSFLGDESLWRHTRRPRTQTRARAREGTHVESPSADRLARTHEAARTTVPSSVRSWRRLSLGVVGVVEVRVAGGDGSVAFGRVNRRPGDEAQTYVETVLACGSVRARLPRARALPTREDALETERERESDFYSYTREREREMRVW